MNGGTDGFYAALVFMAEIMMPMQPLKRLSNACWEKGCLAIVSCLHLCNPTLGELGCAAFRLSVSSLCSSSRCITDAAAHAA